MIKLFASDLDGTLLNEKHDFDDAIIQSIKEVIKNQKYFVIATGRSMFEGQRKELNAIKGSYYTICMNGALIYDNQEKVIYKKPINPNIIEDILKKFPTVDFECCLSDQVLMRCSEEENIKEFEKTNLWASGNGKALYDNFCMNNVYDVKDDEMIRSEVLKMNCRVRDEQIRKQLFEYLELHQDEIMNAPFEESYFEITKVGVNKATALQYLATLLHVENDEIAVYGDGCNDLEMLSLFKHSFTTANANEKAKQCASQVIGCCKDHAVSQHIMKTLIEEESEK